MDINRRIIFLFIILTLFVGQNKSHALIKSTNNHPDSVYTFTYHHGDPTSGIRMLYSIDKKNWYNIGHDFSFVKSDFGTWGRFKKMENPSVIYDNSKWYAVWEVNKDGDQFATTLSEDFWTWKPQDYPYLRNNENFEMPILLKSSGFFVVYYKTSSNNFYKVTSRDFVKWSTPEKISSNLYNSNNNKHTIVFNGESLIGNINKVPYNQIDILKLRANDSQRRGELSNESCRQDESRFRNVSSISAVLDIKDTSHSISDNLIGIFFEDINYSADGGLYAELIQNRDFEYNSLDRGEWNAKSFWEVKGDFDSFEISEKDPIHPNNSHYAVLKTSTDGTKLLNNGFDGIVLKKGSKYDFSMFAKYIDKGKYSISISLIDGNKTIAKKEYKINNSEWKKYDTVLTATDDSKNATLCIEVKGAGRIGLDFISLFPQDTFNGRKNGLRKDLAQILADMKPKFIRFPGGCVSHGNGLDNMYRWIETVGPLWERKSQSNIWGYHQSKGLGFYEYFQFCEDIGADPLPVLPAGVCCQNSSRGGHGQQGGLPMDEMDTYTQELLNLIEWANGDAATSKYAKMRAEAGHPKPFGLKMIGVGNEDLISDVFTERFNYINRKIKQVYPDIQVVGTVGPFFEGSDYEYGWKLAKEENVDIVDEHYYVNPGWYIHNQNYYDTYDRKGTKVYLGEWASRGNNMENALVEALHVTNLERNADVVVMSSYAPLLAKHGHTQWNPDLIYFNNTDVFPTVNYFVQYLCGNNSGDTYINSELNVETMIKDRDGKESVRFNEDVSLRVKSSVVKDSNTEDLIIKIVNITPFKIPVKINLKSINDYNKIKSSVISGNPSDKEVNPIVKNINMNDLSDYYLPAYSFTVLRLSK